MLHVNNRVVPNTLFLGDRRGVDGGASMWVVIDGGVSTRARLESHGGVVTRLRTLADAQDWFR